MATRGRKIDIDDREFTKDWITYQKVQDMAIKFGIHPRTVLRHAERLGLNPRLGPRKHKEPS